MTNNTQKCYLDSNVQIYWDNKESVNHQSASAIVKKLENDGTDPVISPLVIDEFIHAVVLEARKDASRNVYDIASESLHNLFQLPSLAVVNPPNDFESQKAVVKLMEKFSLRPRDAYHLLTMQANKINSFATFDSDFSKVFVAKTLQRKI